MGGGGASGSSGVPSNSSGQAVAYQPSAQLPADIGYQGLLGAFGSTLSPGAQSAFSNLFPNAPNFGSNPFSGTPGGVSYGMASPFIGGAGTNTITDPYDPFYLQALGGSQGAAAGAGGVNSLAGLLEGGLPGLYNTQAQQDYTTAGQLAPIPGGAAGALAGELPSYFQQSATTAQNLGNLVSNILPGAVSQAPQAVQGAQNQSNLLSNLGNLITGAASGTLPYYTYQGEVQGNNLNNYGNSILQTAFDPQQALYNQLQNQVSQQAQAANSAAGLGGSAYGASTAGNTLSNFDINWQNQQLGRQAQGLGAAIPAFQASNQLPYSALQQGGALENVVGQSLAQSNALPALIGEQYGALGSTLGQLQNTASNLPASYASGLGSAGQSLGQLASMISGLNALPASSLASLTGQLPSLYQGGATLAGLPYNTQSTGASNALQGLGSYTNLGNQQYTIPQQLANDLQSYLQLGQAASGLSGQLGALGLNEQQQGFAGIGSALGTGSNLLFGNSLGTQGGLLGLAGLNPFSTAGLPSAAASGAAIQAALPGLGDAALGGSAGFGAGSTAAAAAAGGGGGFSAADLLALGGLF